jgi:hypothetical protein
MRTLPLAALLAGGIATDALAQQPTPTPAAPAAAAEPRLPETIRGRVLDDSARVVRGAQVIVTRGPDRRTQETTTDSLGQYAVRFEEGTGDYLVYVTSPGLGAARRRVQREGANRTLVADFTLARDPTMLAAVRVRGERPVRATNTTSPNTLETGASEKWADGVSGQLPPTVAGDLNALALTMPGITMSPNGPTILGASGESNLATLNGLGFAGGNIPRAARTQVRVTGATFDATRGGFTGANIDVRLGPGDRMFQNRSAFLTLDPPALQFTDAVGRGLAVPSGGFRGSFGADGELVRRTLTYNVGLDVARSTSDPVTLTGASDGALLRAGLAPDSAERLLAVAGPLGLARGSGIPGARRRDALTWLGRLDDTRDTLQTRTLTAYAALTREGALGFAPLVAPTAGGEQRERTLGMQLAHGIYVGAGRNVLTETRAAASQVRSETSGYRTLPGATVLVRSSDATSGRDVTAVSVGGAPFLARDDARWTLEGGNETTWNARGRRHRFRTALWGRGDGLAQVGLPNAQGSFTFNSIADLQAGRPASFTRTLAQPAREGTAWNGAAAFSHQWIPTRYASVMWGARVEGNAFGGAPARNPALEQALGVRTGVAPARLHVSPRLGFNYQYNRDRTNGIGTRGSPAGTWYRYPTGTIRGGIGEFRDLLRPNLLAEASAATGLAGGTTLLSCVGSAVPAVDWAAFAANTTAIPDRCADGGGVLAERAPAATLVDPSFDVPRSWRASLDWTTSVRSLVLRAGALGSYDLNQPGLVDANFAGVPRFALAGEGGRPVFVTEAAIDPATGGVSAAQSRVSSQFGRVGVRTSDLRGYGGQLTLAVSRDHFRGRGSFLNDLDMSFAYTLQGTRRQYRGFDGAAFGDPRAKEWAAGPNDARHVMVYQLGYYSQKLGALTMFARAQSGLPFTPLVQGDVNGDGRGSDRAYVPDPARESDAVLASGMRGLLAGGSETARECLARQLGAVAGRNACRGPWTATMNVQWQPRVPGRWARRVSPNVYLQNVLGGVDQLLHGSAGLRGWGMQTLPDANLLVPRGFDAATRQFRYDVNPRFADTRPARTLMRDPFRIVLDVSVNLAVPQSVQQLRRAVEPIRTASGWQRRSADSLAAFYLSRTSSLHRALLMERDSLFLSAAQIAALRQADSVYSASVRAIYVDLGRFLESRGDRAPGKIEMDSVSASDRAYWRLFWEQPEIADSIVTPAQKELFPLLRNLVSAPKPNRVNMFARFGAPVPFRHQPLPTR